MATTPQKEHSHPICPNCQSDVSDRTDLTYFVSNSVSGATNDDVEDLHEETSRLVSFLGALAAAGPLAVAFHFAGIEKARNDDPPEWVTDYTWLAEELTKETDRRLNLLRKAGRIWQDRAAAQAQGKEG